MNKTTSLLPLPIFPISPLPLFPYSPFPCTHLRVPMHYISSI
jgi:hypothetical protein